MLSRTLEPPDEIHPHGRPIPLRAPAHFRYFEQTWRCLAASHDAKKKTLKRFMPVARGTRPAYRKKTRGVLVFGDSPKHSPTMTRGDLYTCIRRDLHSYRRL